MRSSGPRPPAPVAPTEPLPRTGSTTIRVRYCECDPMGVAHHAAYIPWLEIARTEMLRGEGDGGLTYAQMEAVGLFLVITKLDIQFKRPARYDDLVRIDTTVSGGGRARLDHAYTAHRVTNDPATNNELLVTATTTLACVDASGRPSALPDWLRADSHR
ncbi:MAG: thioesterase family protein [Phycisphaerales bacterium]